MARFCSQWLILCKHSAWIRGKLCLSVNDPWGRFCQFQMSLRPWSLLRLAHVKHYVFTQNIILSLHVHSGFLSSLHIKVECSRTGAREEMSKSYRPYYTPSQRICQATIGHSLKPLSQGKISLNTCVLPFEKPISSLLVRSQCGRP